MKLNFSQKRRWKVLLFIGASLISVFFLVFTNFLVRELSKKEVADVEKIADAYHRLNTSPEDASEILGIIQQTTIPILVVDKDSNLVLSKNVDTSLLNNAVSLKTELRKMAFYNDPIKILIEPDNPSNFQWIYFQEQRAITLLRYFPYVQLLLIAVFLTVSYVAFNSSKMYEQNKVWVGMAKETAHQIGTPLSSLMAWVDYLKQSGTSEEVITELEKDIERLEVITERFSKIGSTPELFNFNLYDITLNSINYLRKRISNKVTIEITEDSNQHVHALINKNLFSWVIENLTKNAVDAMNGKGSLKFHIWEGRHHVYLDITDTGKGIGRAFWGRVFEPGFTTRKRGWGLGLSLSKRIINDYHKGDIYVKESEIGSGTTFRIKLQRSIPKIPQ